MLVRRHDRSALGFAAGAACASLAAFAALPAAGCDPLVESAVRCEYGGKTYEPGDQLPAGGPCNTSCTCMDDGSVACPAVACDPGCEYQGQFYAPGESFPAGDGCNNCGCGEDGMVACTAMACEGCWDQGQHYLPGETFPAGDGCNTCSCMDYGSLECTAMACPSGCEYQGQLYAPGESFPAGDGCNTCSCAQDGTGEVLCTQMPCAGECVYLGNSYQQGETFPSVDGCNDCTCTVKGVVCTDKACPCDPDKEWWRKYVSTDPDECKLIDYGCPENTTSFENACGCGCEQDLSCPQWFDCEPPNPCDVEAIKKKCPYSGIAY